MEDKQNLKNEEDEQIELTEDKQKMREEIDLLINKSKDFKRQADEELKAEDYEEAIKLYIEGIKQIKTIRAKRILSDDELNKVIMELVVPSNLNLAFIDLKEGRWDDLINHSTKVLNIDTTNTKARYRRCVGYINKSDFDKAEEDFFALKKQIGNSTEIKVLEEMLKDKKGTSHDEFYKKMGSSLKSERSPIIKENKGVCLKIKDFFYTKVFCCCFKRKRKSAYKKM